MREWIYILFDIPLGTDGSEAKQPKLKSLGLGCCTVYP